jgi:hypothetical protein
MASHNKISNGANVRNGIIEMFQEICQIIQEN